MAKTKRKPPRAPKPKLTPAQRRADANPLYDPSVQLSGHALSDAADALVGAEFTPKLAAIGRQARSAETQGTALINNASDYYGQLDKRSADAAAREAAIRDALSAGLEKIGASAGASVDASRGDVIDRLAADRATMGQGLAGGGDQHVLDELAAQRARVGENAQAYQASGAAQGASAEQLLTELAAATQARGGELHGQLTNRLANTETALRGQRADLEAQRGDARVKELTTLRQQGFENAVTQAGLGIKQQDLAAQIANQDTQAQLAAQRIASTNAANRARIRAQRRGQDVTVRGQDLSHQDRQASIEERRLAATNKKAASQGKEPAAAVKTKRSIQNTLLALQGGHSVRWLQNQGAAPDVIQAAQDLQRYHYVLPDTYRMLLRLGMDVPKEWRPPAHSKNEFPKH